MKDDFGPVSVHCEYVHLDVTNKVQDQRQSVSIDWRPFTFSVFSPAMETWSSRAAIIQNTEAF
jgi:hypothetical protein